MTWEILKRAYAGRAVMEPIITLLKDRTGISVSAGLFEKMGYPDAFQILYDKERHKLGIRACSINEQFAYRGYRYDLPKNEPRTIQIHCCSALRQIHDSHLDVKAAMPLTAEEENDGIWAVDLPTK